MSSLTPYWFLKRNGVGNPLIFDVDMIGAFPDKI